MVSLGAAGVSAGVTGATGACASPNAASKAVAWTLESTEFLPDETEAVSRARGWKTRSVDATRMLTMHSDHCGARVTFAHIVNAAFRTGTGVGEN